MGQTLSTFLLASGRKRYTGSVLVILVYLLYRRRKSANARKLAEQNGGGKNDPKNAKSKIWELIWPKSYFTGYGRYILVIVAFHMWRVWQAYRLLDLVRQGDTVIFDRNRAHYMRNEINTFILSLEMLTFQHVSGYVRSLLKIKWQQKLANVLYGKYFDKVNYYHIENEMKNVDVVMTTEIAEIAEGFSKYIDAGVYNIVSGGFYLLKIWYEYGFLYSFTPFIYIFAAKRFADYLVPMDWRLFGALNGAKGAYRGAQTRIVVHGESISALRGGEREKTILQKMLGNVVGLQRNIYDKLYSFSMTQEFLVHRLMWTGVGWFVVGRGVFDPLPTVQTVAKIASKRAEVGYQFVLYLQVVFCAMTGVGVLTEYNKLQGPSERVTKLIDTLDKIDARESAQSGKAFKSGETIKFEDVDIYTPTGNLLVKDLSFEVTSNSDSMLLTGHNGAGKSSIFRCLAGIWKIPKGEITKPHTYGTRSVGDIFYLPQKPYNVIGTLIDQMTYPRAASDGDAPSSEVLNSLLSKVGLEYLLDRQGALTEEINWEEELSLGEKQRLAIARVIYHKPRFAVLDECTSGVAVDMERKLYYLLNEMGISYVTISHRPMLSEMHCKFLCLNGDDDKTYEYKILRNPTELKQNLAKDENKDLKASSQAMKSDEVVATYQAERSKQYDYITNDREQRKKDMKNAFKNESALNNLSKVLSGAIPNGWKKKSVKILLGILVEAALTVGGNLLGIRLFKALFTRDRGLLYRTMGLGVINAALQSLTNQYTKWVQNVLQIDLFESLSKKFMTKYIEKAGYYGLKTIDGRITDPESRLADDMKQFTEMLSSLMMDVFNPVVNVFIQLIYMGTTVGYGNAGILYGYLICSGIFVRWIMPDFKSMTAQQNAADAKLQFTLNTVRTHSEAIAFFGGGDREAKLAQSRLDFCFDRQYQKLWANLWFGATKHFFVLSFPDRVQQYLRFSYAEQNFSDEALLADGGAALSAGQHVIWGVQNNIKDKLQKIIDVSDTFNNFSGIIMRLAELDKAIDELRLPPFMVDSLVAKTESDGSKPKNPYLTLQNLDVVTPTGESLGRDINIKISRKNRLMITGPNASGKTAFFRVLGGLWPKMPEGKDSKASIKTNGDIFLVPQRVYSVRGSLFDQITYPAYIEESIIKQSDYDHAQKLLDLVGIGYLVSRDGGWNSKRKFEDVLSLGEQQRLGMARLFYNNPSFAILDECTDAVSVDVEEKLYSTAQDMGIICITISKRLALAHYHEKELKFGEAVEDGVTMVDV